MSSQSMMTVRYKRPRWGNEAKKAAVAQKQVIAARLIMALHDMQSSILETPVYTGRTLVNFRWSIGSPVSGTRAAISEPPLPGKTSDLPLGGEPRRKANAARVQEEFEMMIKEVRANPFQNIYLVNNLDHFSDVEYGTYAHAEGKHARTPPYGMTRRGETLLEYDLMGYVKRVA